MGKDEDFKRVDSSITWSQCNRCLVNNASRLCWLGASLSDPFPCLFCDFITHGFPTMHHCILSLHLCPSPPCLFTRLTTISSTHYPPCPGVLSVSFSVLHPALYLSILAFYYFLFCPLMTRVHYTKDTTMKKKKIAFWYKTGCWLLIENVSWWKREQQRLGLTATTTIGGF